MINELLNGQEHRLLRCSAVLGVWLISALIVAGWNFAYMQGIFQRTADGNRREDLGWAMVIGMLYGCLGPIGVLLAWLMTGFAEHGWRLTSKTPNARADLPPASDAARDSGTDSANGGWLRRLVRRWV